MAIRLCIPPTINVSVPGLTWSSVLSSGSRQPTEMRWSLRCLLMWCLLHLGQLRVSLQRNNKQKTDGNWTGSRSHHPQQQCLSANTLQTIATGKCPSIQFEETLSQLISHRNFPWEILCLLHQLVVNRKIKKKILFDRWYYFLGNYPVHVLVRMFQRRICSGYLLQHCS